jgi:hypothetical protein
MKNGKKLRLQDNPLKRCMNKTSVDKEEKHFAKRYLPVDQCGAVALLFFPPEAKYEANLARGIPLNAISGFLHPLYCAVAERSVVVRRDYMIRGNISDSRTRRKIY